MGPFFSDLGPESGLVRFRDVDGTTRVFGDAEHSVPMGQARCIGWDAAGSAVWRLVVQDESLEDSWVIVDGEFVPAGADWRDLYGSDFQPESETWRRDFDARRSRHPRASGPSRPDLPAAIP